MPLKNVTIFSRRLMSFYTSLHRKAYVHTTTTASACQRQLLSSSKISNVLIKTSGQYYRYTAVRCVHDENHPTIEGSHRENKEDGAKTNRNLDYFRGITGQLPTIDMERSKQKDDYGNRNKRSERKSERKLINTALTREDDRKGTDQLNKTDRELAMDQQAVVTNIGSIEDNYKHENDLDVAIDNEDNIKQEGNTSALEPRTAVAEGNHANELNLTGVHQSDVELTIPRTNVPLKANTLDVYVDMSETLTKLVKLGVDLHKIERKHRDAANMLLKSNYKTDIEPYIAYFVELGIPLGELGSMFSKNPYIFEESLENLEVRRKYFVSKNFKEDAIARILSKAPLILSMKVANIDSKLGHFQKELMLTGDEVRLLATRKPKLITFPIQTFEKMRFHLNEFMGFSRNDIKSMLFSTPRLFLQAHEPIEGRFEYLYNEMKIPNSLIAHWPGILLTRLRIIKERHLFLASINKDQYDPTQVNYVSLKKLVTGKDRDFCFEVGKRSMKYYNDFLETLFLKDGTTISDVK